MFQETTSTYREAIIEARVRVFEGLRDEKYLTKPFYERASSEPDYSIGKDALKLAKKKGLI